MIFCWNSPERREETLNDDFEYFVVESLILPSFLPFYLGGLPASRKSPNDESCCLVGYIQCILIRSIFLSSTCFCASNRIGWIPVQQVADSLASNQSEEKFA